MKKNQLENKGVPLFVDATRDLPARAGATFDSYFVSSEFEHDGERYAFVWHQQSLFGQLVTAEVQLTTTKGQVWSNNALTLPLGQGTSIAADKLDVRSPFGSLTGDREKMRLSLQVEDGTVEATLRPRRNVLYNGGEGLLKFLGNMDNHQYSFPNMDVEGTLTIKGESVPITNTTAWFDRQGGHADSASELLQGGGMDRLAWLWVGFPLNEDRSAAVSLWDSYASDGRHCFATVVDAEGRHANYPTEITYRDTWTSKRSGCTYPAAVDIAIPLADIALTLTIMPGDPEFHHPENGLSGFEALCRIEGSHVGEPISRYGFLEIVGDVCGDL